MPFFYDFRGRKYYDSSIGPTSLKFSRYFFYYGYYDYKIPNNKELSYIISANQKNINSVKLKYNFNENIENIDETIFWILIALGKMGIDKKILEISATEFIKIGLELINDSIEWPTIIEQVEHYHLLKLFNTLCEWPVKKFIIEKDITASFMQTLVKIIGPKDTNSLRYTNLYSNNTWINTYNVIISNWINKYFLGSNNENLKYFNRSTLKKSIMTNFYSVTYLQSFKYFSDAVNEKFKIKIEFQSEIEILFKNFYKFVRNDVETEFFLKKNSQQICDYALNKILLEKNIIIESHDSKSHLIYYKFILKNIDSIITMPDNTKKRIKKKYRILDKKNIRMPKVKASIRPNWNHFYEAAYVRAIELEMNETYITIHDCVLVDFLNISNFIHIANKCNNNNICPNILWHKPKITYFSLFTFL